MNDGVSPLCFCFKRRPVRYVRVPFDQCGNRPRLVDRLFVEIPHNVCNVTVVSIDEKRAIFFVCFLCVAGQMDLLHGRERVRIEIRKRVPMLIDRRNVHVIDVEQKTASRPQHDGGNEVGL